MIKDCELISDKLNALAKKTEHSSNDLLFYFL